MSNSSKPGPPTPSAADARPKAERVVEKILRNDQKTIYVDLKKNAPNSRHQGFHIRATENAGGGRRSAIVIPLDLAAEFASVLLELLQQARELN